MPMESAPIAFAGSTSEETRRPKPIEPYTIQVIITTKTSMQRTTTGLDVIPWMQHQRSFQIRSPRNHLRLHATKQTTVDNKSPSKPHITIIGGGVIGLTSALKILQSFHSTVDVTITAQHFVSNTTTAGSGGLWKPYALSSSDPETINRWASLTFNHYRDIYLSKHARAAGVFLTPAYELYAEPGHEDPFWKDITPGFRHLTPHELAFHDPTGKHIDGITYHTFIAEGRIYCEWIMQQLRDSYSNVTFQTQKLESIGDIIDSTSAKHRSDVIVNCSGLGARELVKDPLLYPIRGHVLRVKAPWVRYHVESHGSSKDGDSLPVYIIPNSDTVVLGGTKGYHQEDTTPKPEDSRAILERCSAVVPSLASAEVVDEWVGLRPGRETVRVELEEAYDIGRDGLRVPVIHNFGHGGSGLTLGWGCACDVAEMVSKLLG